MKQEDFKKLKTSELIDIYPKTSDEESLDFMSVIWNRFPFDVWEDERKEYDKRISNLEKQTKELQKLLDMQTRVLNRIDRLTQAVSGRKK